MENEREEMSRSDRICGSITVHTSILLTRYNPGQPDEKDNMQNFPIVRSGFLPPNHFLLSSSSFVFKNLPSSRVFNER